MEPSVKGAFERLAPLLELSLAGCHLDDCFAQLILRDGARLVRVGKSHQFLSDELSSSVIKALRLGEHRSQLLDRYCSRLVCIALVKEVINVILVKVAVAILIEQIGHHNHLFPLRFRPHGLIENSCDKFLEFIEDEL